MENSIDCKKQMDINQKNSGLDYLRAHSSWIHTFNEKASNWREILKVWELERYSATFTREPILLSGNNLASPLYHPHQVLNKLNSGNTEKEDQYDIIPFLDYQQVNYEELGKIFFITLNE